MQKAIMVGMMATPGGDTMTASPQATAVTDTDVRLADIDRSAVFLRSGANAAISPTQWREFAAQTHGRTSDVYRRCAELADTVWVLVDDFGEGVPCCGPFASFAEAAAFDPYDERFEPREMPRVDAEAALAECQRRADERYAAARINLGLEPEEAA